MEKHDVTNGSLAGYCGIYCGDCYGYKGSIANLARDLREELRKNKFAEVAKAIPFKEFKSYAECYECLGAMVKLRCKGCRNGSRSKYCNIANCALKKEYEGCWECDKFETCEKFDFLKPIHKDANLKNLRKIKKQGIEPAFRINAPIHNIFHRPAQVAEQSSQAYHSNWQSPDAFLHLSRS